MFISPLNCDISVLYRDLIAPRTKEKAGAPPVQGLMESMTTPGHTPDRRVGLGAQLQLIRFKLVLLVCGVYKYFQIKYIH